MKKTILLLLLSVTSVVYAENIIIKQKSGNETVLDLSSNPIITFSDENMVVTNDFTTITFPLGDIDSYVVRNGSSDINEVIGDAPLFRDGHILLSGMRKGMSASIYSFDGKKVGQQTADETGGVDIFLGNYPKGAYVISTPNHNIKFINK